MSSIPSPRADKPGEPFVPLQWPDDAAEHRRLLAEAIVELQRRVTAIEAAATTAYPGAVMYGNPAAITLNTTNHKLVQYGAGGSWNYTGPSIVDLTAGEITIPQDGNYRLTFAVFGSHATSGTGVDVFLKMGSVGGILPPIIAPVSLFHVSGPSSDECYLVSVSTRFLYEDQVLSLYMSAEANLGLFIFSSTTFEVVMQSPESI